MPHRPAPSSPSSSHKQLFKALCVPGIVLGARGMKTIGHSLPGQTDAPAHVRRAGWQEWKEEIQDVIQKTGLCSGTGGRQKPQKRQEGSQELLMSPRDPTNPARWVPSHPGSRKPTASRPLQHPRLSMHSSESALTIHLFNFQQEGEDLSGLGIRLA